MYSFLASASYSQTLKVSNYYYIAGILAGIVANVLWLSIAKNETNPSKLVMTGLYWDVMLTMVYILIPFLFFGAQANLWQVGGIATIVVGIFLTKVT
jgi:hypothetical protein